MTKLRRIFEQRQLARRRISIKSGTSGTVSSYEVENHVTFDDEVPIQETSSAAQGRPALMQQITINSSSDVKIGDEVHIHYNQLKEVKTRDNLTWRLVQIDFPL